MQSDTRLVRHKISLPLHIRLHWLQYICVLYPWTHCTDTDTDTRISWFMQNWNIWCEWKFLVFQFFWVNMFDQCEIKCWFDWFVSTLDQLNNMDLTQEMDRLQKARAIGPPKHKKQVCRDISTYVWLCLPTLYQLQCKRSIYEVTDIFWISLFFLSLSLSYTHETPFVHINPQFFFYV